MDFNVLVRASDLYFDILVFPAYPTDVSGSNYGIHGKNND